MSKTRIHELAKELSVTTKELIDSAHTLGYEVKNHMSALEDSEIKQLKGRFMKKATDNTEGAPISKPVVNSASDTKTEVKVETTEKTATEVKEHKHNKIIYDRTKEIREEENRRAQRSQDNRTKTGYQIGRASCRERV